MYAVLLMIVGQAVPDVEVMLDLQVTSGTA